MVHAAIRGADGINATNARVPVSGGSLVVHVDRGPDHDDRLVLDELSITYRDVVLPPAYFHDGQVLTSIGVRLEQPLSMPLHWAADGAAWASGTTDLRLDWSLHVGDGEAYPLGSQDLRGLDLDLVVNDRDGDLRVELGVFHRGVMWSWAEVITLGDLDLQAMAYADID